MPDDTALNVQDVPEEPKKELKACENCMWWLRAYTAPEEAKAWGKSAFDFGECRAVPPTALSTNRTYEAAGDRGKARPTVTIKQARWPHTYNIDWCGMWTPKQPG